MQENLSYKVEYSNKKANNIVENLYNMRVGMQVENRDSTLPE